MRGLIPGLINRENGTTCQSRTFEHGAGDSCGLWQRMALDSLLVGHRGCVNHVEFNEQGSLLASGSDDMRVCLWDLQSSKPATVISTGHSQNIFCAKFMPGSSGSSQPVLATCAGDGDVRLHDLASGAKSVFDHHTSRVKKLVTEPGNPHLLISCSEDGTVRQIDVRQPARNATQLLQLARNGVKLEINSISSPWHKPWLLAVGASDDLLRVYDRRTTGTTAGSRPRRTGPKCVSHFSPFDSGDHSFTSNCITGVQFAADGTQLLANYLGDYVYLWSMEGDRSNSTSKLGKADGHAAAAALERKCKRLRQDDSAGAAAAAGKMGEDSHDAGKDSGVERSAADAAANGDDTMQVDAAEQAATVAGPDEFAAAPSAAGGGNSRVLTADTAVELIERGELHVRRRLGSLARMILNRSQDLYERGEVEASLRYSTAALQLQPALGMAHYQSAVCHQQLGNTAAALAAGEAALQYAWNYDLDRFVRRLRREVNSSTAAAAAEGQGQASSDTQQEQQQRGVGEEGASAEGRPLPAALVQRLQARGIIQEPAAAAAAAAAGGDFAHSKEPAEGQPEFAAAPANGGDGQDVGTQAAAAVHLVPDGDDQGHNNDHEGDQLFAGVGEAADGGSESWEPPSDDGSSSSSSDADISGSSSDGSRASEDPDGSVTSDEDGSALYQIGSFSLLASSSDQPSNNPSDSDSISDAGDGSSNSGSRQPSEDWSSGPDSEVLDSLSWSSGEGSDDEDAMDDILGLDLRHRFYDWGEQHAAASSDPLQQQAGQRSASRDEDHDDSRQHFAELIEPLKHQIRVLQARRQQRIAEQQRQQRRMDRSREVMQQPELQEPRLQQLQQFEHVSRERRIAERSDKQKRLHRHFEDMEQQHELQPLSIIQPQMYQIAAEYLGKLDQQQDHAGGPSHPTAGCSALEVHLLLPLGQQYCPEGGQQQQWQQQQRGLLAGLVELLLPDDDTERCEAFADLRTKFALEVEEIAQCRRLPGNYQQIAEPMSEQHLRIAAQAYGHELRGSFEDELKQLQAWQRQQQQQQQVDSQEQLLQDSAAAAAAGSNDVVAVSSDEDDSEPLSVGDLLDERDDLIMALGAALAAGEYGHSSSSKSSIREPSAATNAAADENSRLGAAVLDDSRTLPTVDAAAATATGAGGGEHSSSAARRCQKWSCRYRGHLNAKTIKDVSFVGPNETMVAAGSDDGRLFVWDRYTGELVTALRADRCVVNCIASHPNLPMMASCGIDNTVKLWTPCLDQPRPVDSNMHFCLGYNELERAIEDQARDTGFGGWCKAFSKQNAAKMVQQIRQQQAMAAAGR